MTTTEQKLAELKQQQQQAEEQKRKLEEQIRDAEEQMKREENQKSRELKTKVEHAVKYSITELDGKAGWVINSNLTVYVDQDEYEMTVWRTEDGETTEETYYFKTRDDELEDQKCNALRDRNWMRERRVEDVRNGDTDCGLDDWMSGVENDEYWDEEIKEQAGEDHNIADGEWISEQCT